MMRRLIQIEWIKIRSNATFWVLTSLHVAIVLLIVMSGKIFLKNLDINGESLKGLVDQTHIPIYQFPDIWHNVTYVAGYLKFILAIYMIISITNEFAFDTLRQNIMNGLNRVDFIATKLLLAAMLALGSTLFIFLTGLTAGLASTPQPAMADMLKYAVFVPAYFLQLCAYLVFALLVGLWIRRTGLAMGLLFLYTLIIEPLIALRIDSDLVKGFLPLKAISNLIHMPFGKYLLREIQDFVTIRETVIVIVYMAIFLFLIHVLLRKRDLK